MVIVISASLIAQTQTQTQKYDLHWSVTRRCRSAGLQGNPEDGKASGGGSPGPSICYSKRSFRALALWTLDEADAKLRASHQLEKD